MNAVTNVPPCEGPDVGCSPWTSLSRLARRCFVDEAVLCCPFRLRVTVVVPGTPLGSVQAPSPGVTSEVETAVVPMWQYMRRGPPKGPPNTLMVLPPPSSIGLFSTMSSRTISPKLSETFVPNFGTATETSVPMGAGGPEGGVTSRATCLDDTKRPQTGACIPTP